MDLALSSDDTVAIYLLLIHAKISASMGFVPVILNEGSLVEEKLNSLPSSELVLLMLLVNPGLAATSDKGLVDLAPSLLECFFRQGAEGSTWLPQESLC